MTTNELQLMSSGLVIASPTSGGGLAMIGVVVLLGAIAALIYFVRDRR